MLLLCRRTKRHLVPGTPSGSPGKDGEGRQELASPCGQLCSASPQPGPSLFCSQAVTPQGGNPEPGLNEGPSRARARARASRDGRWGAPRGDGLPRSGAEELAPGAHQAAPPPGTWSRSQSAVPTRLGSASSVWWPRRRQAGCWEGGTQRAMRSGGVQGGWQSLTTPVKEAPPLLRKMLLLTPPHGGSPAPPLPRKPCSAPPKKEAPPLTSQGGSPALSRTQRRLRLALPRPAPPSSSHRGSSAFPQSGLVRFPRDEAPGAVAGERALN